MNQSANVRSVESLQLFKNSMINFADDARNALTGVDMEIRRIRDWLMREQLTHWQHQVKRGNEAVAMARSELHRRHLAAQGSDAMSDTEQKDNLRIAKRKLEEAEAKVVVIKKWIPVLEHAISEYNSASQPLGDRLTGQFLNSLALLERSIAAIDAYLTYQPPTTQAAAPTGTGGSSAPASGRPAAVTSSAAAGESQSAVEDAPPPSAPVAEEPAPAEPQPTGVTTP